jgi:hypothetical protein
MVLIRSEIVSIGKEAVLETEPTSPLKAVVCRESALPANLAWRVHRPRDEGICASMIELALNPVVHFLLVEPGLRKGRGTKCPSAALEEVNHFQGVSALRTLDSQPRLNPGQKGLR